MAGVRYCLLSDGDGHQWLCPVERADEGTALIEAAENYDWAHTTEEPPPNPDAVDWLQRVDNPTRLTFTDPREDL